MKMPNASLIDRLSILVHKVEKIGESYLPEFFQFAREVLLEIDPATLAALRKLYEINGKIWSMEADLRKGKEGELSLEEIGRRAIRIRDENNRRVSVMNEVAELTHEFKEIKKDHASE